MLPFGSAHLLQLVEGRAAARLLRGQGGEAAPQRRSVRCTPVQHSAAWWAACWCCARCLRGGWLRAARSERARAMRPLWFSPSSLPSPHLRPHLRRPRLLEMSTSLSHRESAQPSLAVTAANDVGSTSAAHAATGPSPSSSRPRPPQRSPPQCNARMVVLGKGCRRVLTTGRAQFMSAI